MKYSIKDNLSVYAMVVFKKAEKLINDRLSIDIKARNLTVTQFGVLDILYSKGRMKIGQLIEKMFTTSGNMTCVIKNMEKTGLIYRVQDPTDKRAFLIDITDKGREIIEELLPVHRANIEDVFNVLTTEDKQNLITILKKFKETGEQ